MNPNHDLQKAVHKNIMLSRSGLLERIFTAVFKGLVYPQIWEDPDVDMEALCIAPDSHVVAIASGGCNVLSYLLADPARITAVDLNAAHVVLTCLRLCAAGNLPDYDTFHRFFGEADDRANMHAYNRYLKHHLDSDSRKYWQTRDITGRRRISLFNRNFYRAGLLGRFIGTSHLLARLYGLDPERILSAKSLEEQRSFFHQTIAPLFDKRLVRWMVTQPVSLFGLGIPPAQYVALAASGNGDMAAVLRQRLEHLACDFDLKDNYFAWQAFGRRYGEKGRGPLPPYLQRQNYALVRERASRVDVRHISFTDVLEKSTDNSLDRYVLLDAQDWMSDDELSELWRRITRTARPGARVIFRTAAEARLLPGRVPQDILTCWDYDAKLCADLTRRDRSAVYGGVHLYTLKE